MAKNKVDALELANGSNRFDGLADTIGKVDKSFDRIETATNKYNKNKRRGSIIKSAQQNVFEFPAFVSNTIPVDYATATVSLLEQIYAAYLQIAVSINPFVDADTAKKGLQFADFKTDTNKYLEYTDTMYQHAICDPVYTEGDVQTSFELISVDDDTARFINEAMDYQPLSEFDHFWQEAPLPDNALMMVPEPRTYTAAGQTILAVDNFGRPIFNENNYVPLNEVINTLAGVGAAGICNVDAAGNVIPVNRIFQIPNNQSPVDYYTGYIQTNHLSYDPLRYNQTVAQTNNFNRSNPSQSAVLKGLDTGISLADKTIKTASDTSTAIKNIATLKDQIANEKLRRKKAEKDLENYDKVMGIKRSELNTKLAGATKTEYVNDQACQKLNTMKPLLMKVGVNMLNKDDTVQPIQYIVGVKVFTRMIPAAILPEVAEYPLKEMNKISRKVKWRAGELKFFRDLVFRIKEKKQTAADSRDPNRKWYRRLYELAHMEGDAPAAAVVQGKSIFKTFLDERRGKGKLAHGMIPNASIIMTQNDADNIKERTGIDLLKGSTAKKFCGELFLISLIIIDTDAQSIKIMLPDMNNDFDVHSIASVEKQLATLSSAGSKTREIFKLLG